MRTPLTVALALALLAAAAAPAALAHADPRADAKKLVARQAAVIFDGDDDSFRALFAPDAIVLGLPPGDPGKELDAFYFRADLFGGSPHTQLRKLKVTSVTAGGDAHTLWLTAELSATAFIPEPGVGSTTETVALRLSELAVDDGQGWKIVAAVLDQAGPSAETEAADTPEPLAGATSAGPLAAMLATPGPTAAALAADAGAFVLGTDKRERAVGKAAAKLLRGWSKLALSIDGTPREIRTASWGFAQAHVAWKKGAKLYRMDALLIAIPRPDGSWQPVGLHYTHRAR
jgi:hypothetical protein